MKVIKLTESQYNRLIIESDVAPTLDDGDVNEYNSGEKVSATATVHDIDGNPKYGKPATTDRISKQLTPQNWFTNGRNHGNNSLNY